MRRILIMGVLILCSQAFAGLYSFEDFNSYSPGENVFSQNSNPYCYPDSTGASIVSGGVYDYLFNPYYLADIDPPYFYTLSYDQGNCLALDNAAAFSESVLVWDNMAPKTRYLCFKVSGDASFEIGTASSWYTLPFSWDSGPVSKDVDGTMISIVDGTMLEINSTPAWQLNQDTWYELWIHTDTSGKLCRVYIAEGGSEPSVIVNPSDQSQWWPWINPQADEVSCLALFYGADGSSGSVQVDNFADDSQQYSLASLWHEQGDKVYHIEPSIFAFLVLKSNYGTKTGATFEMGDLDCDGDVDIFDFLIFKANFGTAQ